MPSSAPLLIRADASASVGVGHVMRCLALAQAWQETGAAVHLAMRDCPDGLRMRLEQEGVIPHGLSTEPGSATDATTTAELAVRLGAVWVVVDGYAFGVAHQQASREAGCRVLFVDDYGHADAYTADLLLNQNVYATSTLYDARSGDTQLLLGLQYALLRREFWPWRAWVRETVPQATRVLVTLGGGDPSNVTGRVIDAIGRLEGAAVEAVVLVGAGNPHAQVLRRSCQAAPHIQMHQNVSDMPRLMAWADVAVAAAGSTSWELAFMQLPSITCAIAENQVPIAHALEQEGVTHYLGWHEDVSAECVADMLDKLLRAEPHRAAMSRRGRELVDGRGAQRVVDAMQRLASDSLLAHKEARLS